MSSLQDLILNDRYWIQCSQLAQQAVMAGTLLESLFNMNNNPDEEAMELIAQKVNSTRADVANWFLLRRAIDVQEPINYSAPDKYAGHDQPELGLGARHAKADGKRSCSPIALTNPNKAASNNNNTTTNLNHHNALAQHQQAAPGVPSSTLLAKLNAVTARLTNANYTNHNQLDTKMIDLLNALYKVNDNPEPAAIEMIARRVNVDADKIANWFDKKRLELNPLAGPRSPPVKKREGGRVVTFSEYQRSLLEAIFDENNYLHPQEYEELSNLIQVPSRNIKIWFKNRRSKQRLSGRSTTPALMRSSLNQDCRNLFRPSTMDTTTNSKQHIINATTPGNNNTTNNNSINTNPLLQASGDSD